VKLEERERKEEERGLGGFLLSNDGTTTE